MFFVETSYTFPTYQYLQKGFYDFFILFRSWAGFYTLVFYIVINNSRSKKNKKNLEHTFADIDPYEMYAKVRQRY